jgi:hypothetical protein
MQEFGMLKWVFVGLLLAVPTLADAGELSIHYGTILVRRLRRDAL